MILNQLLSLYMIARSWKLRTQPPHQLDGNINRIVERVLTCGRRSAIQPRQPPH